MPPTIQFRDIPLTTLATALNTPAKRLGVIAGESVVSTGVGNEMDWGNVSISLGAADSNVKMLAWKVTANGGFSLVSDFRLWASSLGYTQALSKVRFQPVSGSDQGAPVNTENYVVNAVLGSYTWADLPENNPGAQNVYPTDEGTSMVIAGASDDAMLIAMYHHIDSGETIGEYKGVGVPGKELQFSLLYTYS